MVERVLRCPDFLHGSSVERRVCYVLVRSVFWPNTLHVDAEVNTSGGGTADYAR